MRGAEGGTILEDEQHDDGARITWEGRCLRAPFAINIIVYGWAASTHFFADEATSRQAYDEMKAALMPALALLPKHDADPIDSAAIDLALAAFARQFP